MTIFEITVGDDGEEIRTPVDLATVTLPDTHPVKVALHNANEEARKKREALKTARAAQTPVMVVGDEADDEEEDEPAAKPVTRQRTQPVVDPAAIAKEAARLAREEITNETQAAAKATADRTALYNKIIKETGLDPSLRAVIEAIPDADQARQMAEDLAARDMRFGVAPSGGNGQHDPSTTVAGVGKRLGIPDHKPGEPLY